MSLDRLMLVVDGPTEEGAIRKRFNMNFHNCPEIRIGPGNGKDYSITGYANGILATLKFALSLNTRAVVLIPDLEKRKSSRINFARKLKKECIDKLVDSTKFKKEDLEDKIHVCPPDIMFENWIVSDIENVSELCAEFDEKIDQEEFDGKNGTSILKNNMNCSYKKTVHGKSFFCKTDFDVSALNSPSFRDFIDTFNELKNKHCA